MLFPFKKIQIELKLSESKMISIKPISEYQQKLAAHYERFGVKALSPNTIMKSCTDRLKVKKSRLFNSQFTVEGRRDFFQKNNAPFLSPDKVWSEKKIDETIDLFHKQINIMRENRTFNKKNLQKTVEELLPDTNIEIKDFSDLRADLEENGIPFEQIPQYLKSNAIHGSTLYNSLIYLNFEKINSAKIKDKAEVIVSTMHEVRHAIRQHKSNDLKLKQKLYCGDINKIDFFSNQYMNFTRPWDTYEQINNINTDTFLEWQKNYYRMPDEVCGNKSPSSLNELHSNFKKAFKFFSHQEDFEFSNKFQERKADLKFIKLTAQNEAGSYKSKNIMREIHYDSSKPTTMEFISLHFKELEKFFHNEIVDTCFTRLQELKTAKKTSKGIKQ